MNSIKISTVFLVFLGFFFFFEKGESGVCIPWSKQVIQPFQPCTNFPLDNILFEDDNDDFLQFKELKPRIKKANNTNSLINFNNSYSLNKPLNDYSFSTHTSGSCQYLFFLKVLRI